MSSRATYYEYKIRKYRTKLAELRGGGADWKSGYYYATFNNPRDNRELTREIDRSGLEGKITTFLKDTMNKISEKPILYSSSKTDIPTKQVSVQGENMFGTGWMFKYDDAPNQFDEFLKYGFLFAYYADCTRIILANMCDLYFSHMVFKIDVGGTPIIIFGKPAKKTRLVQEKIPFSNEYRKVPIDYIDYLEGKVIKVGDSTFDNEDDNCTYTFNKRQVTITLPKKNTLTNNLFGQIPKALRSMFKEDGENYVLTGSYI